MAARVLVTGASGMLGRAVMRQLRGAPAAQQITALGTARSRVGGELIALDMCDADALRRVVAEARPTAVIHCAAERRPDVSEGEQEYTTSLNAEASGHLATLCAEAGAWMVYLSTDYVFDGQPGGAPYAIDATPNPLNHYGVSKLGGEEAVLAVPEAHACVMRVPVLYGLDCPTLAESASLVVAEVLKGGGPDAPKVQVDDWGARFPTLVDDVAACISRIIELKLAEPSACSGPLHFSSPEESTKYQQALLMAEVLGMSAAHLVPDPDAPPGAVRPKNTALDCSETWELLGGMPEMMPLAEGFERALAPFADALRRG